MAIKTPHWAPKGTHPTAKGWMTPSGEIVKKQKFTAEQIAEWHGVSAPAPAPVVQTLHEAPVVETVVAPEVHAFHSGEELEAAEVEEPEEDK